jgi:hypothetical protein
VKVVAIVVMLLLSAVRADVNPSMPIPAARVAGCTFGESLIGQSFATTHIVPRVQLLAWSATGLEGPDVAVLCTRSEPIADLLWGAMWVDVAVQCKLLLLSPIEVMRQVGSIVECKVQVAGGCVRVKSIVIQGILCQRERVVVEEYGLIHDAGDRCDSSLCPARHLYS